MKFVLEVENTIHCLKKNGFALGYGQVLSDSEIQEFEVIIKRLLFDADVAKDFSSNALTITGLAGRDPDLDFLLNKIVSSPQIKLVLTNVLGDEYKIWQINARVSETNDSGLLLHQDSPGETNLVFLLKDQDSKDGCTGFYPGTHLIPRWAKKISWSKISISKFLIKPLLGKKGQHAFFFNKTWHARFPNNNKKERFVVLISFFPVDGIFTPDVFMKDSKRDQRSIELNQLLSVSNGVEKFNENQVRVIGTKVLNVEPAYAIGIERNFSFSIGSIFLYVKLFVLEMIFKPIKLGYLLFKFLM
ncbi:MULTISPECIES: putative 2OG-Fe(II) oxygenase [Leptospira]|uniref:2OG-Fe(II) oxygenase n=1 Tax=Leptospira interrogans serovar Bataviae TaxID=312175 RepID=A0AAP9WJB6_LEPIR|nr:MULTISPECIES: putative 2OG-Fe(II) oxygenase [Leptospira]EKP04893.1 phytanoyl-CoA dioxygenase PhyH [Leptospira kirschneri str. 2008720114]QOI38165.1 putative 2OG-Fe(II) oxygenase [Leptospira interrogans serovar Bataviae]QOI50289.1 putative 2OG-Fe(II) oxygenase [Leptospira interrogans serovar Bataviae]QYY61722.1 putative 2OG-Fe(II) oxygenase [Leptospira interrogans serovar Bataviae]UML83619.1 putative 2OG-Fe(II) oxygenase [Leptospira interrogans]